MNVSATPVFLLNAVTGEAEQGDLLDAITEQQIDDWEGEWLPELFKAIQRLKRAGVERVRWPQSRHWNWREKTKRISGLLGAPAFCVVCGGVTQGMMIADTDRHRARIEVQAGKPLVYVDYIENAPWNRSELEEQPRYRGVGSILIAAAIRLSRELEYRGRIGLHSLPQAEGFYAERCSMSDLGRDEEYLNLRYFEMTPEQADAFEKKGG